MRFITLKYFPVPIWKNQPSIPYLLFLFEIFISKHQNKYSDSDSSIVSWLPVKAPLKRALLLEV